MHSCSAGRVRVSGFDRGAGSSDSLLTEQVGIELANDTVADAEENVKRSGDYVSRGADEQRGIDFGKGTERGKRVARRSLFEEVSSLDSADGAGMRGGSRFEAEQSIEKSPVAIEEEVGVVIKLKLEESEKVEGGDSDRESGTSEREQGSVEKVFEGIVIILTFTLGLDKRSDSGFRAFH